MGKHTESFGPGFLIECLSKRERSIMISMEIMKTTVSRGRHPFKDSRPWYESASSASASWA